MAQDAGDQVEEGGQDGLGAGRRAQRRQLGHHFGRRRNQLLALVLVRRGRRRPKRIGSIENETRNDEGGSFRVALRSFLVVVYRFFLL